MADELVKMCGNLHLTEEEEKGVTLCSSEIDVIRGKSEFCLVGGLIAEKPVNNEAFRKTMAAV